MEKTVKFVKNSLKFKARPKGNVISVKVGGRKFTLPLEARVISHDDYMFLSFSAISELYKVEGKGLVPMSPDSDATAAFTALSPSVPKKRTRRRSSHDMPADLKEALTKVPNGMRLATDGTGKYRLVKKRKRG